jgi:DNA repair protein RecO (recombination protein O)
MSARSWNGKALVLSLSPFGEGHREALLLTEEKGLIRAAVFGGAKSKLRSLVSPWQSGIVWIYTDPVKKSSRITDFDVQFWRQGIRESLIRAWCASVCTEIVTRSHGLSGWVLANAFLDGIAVSDDTECRFALLRFFWRTLHAAGIAPDLAVCARCGSTAHLSCNLPAAARSDNVQTTQNGILYYSPAEEAVFCGQCARAEERRFPLSAESYVWLETVERLNPSQSRLFRPDDASYAELRQFLFFLVSRMVDGPMKTLESAEGIL